ncbi:MAG: hypothetical protein RSB14_07230, partial [Kiritimatiellia bacterium]
MYTRKTTMETHTIEEIFWDNGNLKHRCYVKNGAKVDKFFDGWDGLSEGWFEDGQQSFKLMWKDGKKDGLF